MRMYVLLLVIGLAALGCEAKPPRSSNSPLDLDLEVAGNLQVAYRRIESINGGKLDPEVDKLMRTFENFPTFQKSFAAVSQLTIHEGTPRDEPAEDRPTETIGGEEFYLPPIEVGEVQLKQLQHVFATTEYVYPFMGWKLCGGFHTDWRLAWSDGDGEWIAYICFGCSEMSVVKNGEKVLYCDLRHTENLEDALLLSK